MLDTVGDKAITYGYYALGAIVLYHLYHFGVRLYLQYKLNAHWPKVDNPWWSFFGIEWIMEIRAYSKRFENLELAALKHKRSGLTHMNYVLGQNFVNTNDPENVKAILATQFQDYGKGPIFFHQWEQFLGSSIFNSDGEIWAHNRALMRPQFLKERIADLENFDDKMGEVLDLIKPGEVTDVMDLWFRFTLDSATCHLFGQRSLALQGDNDFARVFARVQELQVERVRRGPSWWLWPRGEYDATIKELDDYVNRYVQMALAVPEEKVTEQKDDESLLMALVRFNRDPKFLRDSLNAALLAGRDTTAATLSWLTLQLSQNTEVFDALRQEVLDTFGKTATPTYTQLKNMKLLQACINETLRMYPIVPMNVRAALRDTTLPRGGGKDGSEPVVVRKGSLVMYEALLMHRLVDIPNVDSWDPYRWLDGPDGRKKYVPKPFTYIPFNAGPRICLGQNFALTEIAYAITKLVQKFSTIEPVHIDRKGLDYRYDIILTPLSGVKVVLRE